MPAWSSQRPIEDLSGHPGDLRIELPSPVGDLENLKTHTPAVPMTGQAPIVIEAGAGCLRVEPLGGEKE